MGRTPHQRRASRDRVRNSRTRIIKRYRAGESINALAADFGVSPNFVANQFDAWSEPRRDRAAALLLFHVRRSARAGSRKG